jgi:hypothetical protein
MMEREVADYSVPLSREMDSEPLGDVERSIGMNCEERIEVADADGAPLRARGTSEREKEEERPLNL